MNEANQMDRVTYGPWVIEIDRRRTEEFYASHHLITQDCSCTDCLHYVQACENFPAEIREFFSALGVDPRKEGEVSEFGRNKDSMQLYIVFYHFAGKIIDGPDQLENEQSYKLAGMDISFTEETELVPEGFPAPVLQVTLEMYL